MKKTIVEDYEFTIEILSVNECRMGFEKGDKFTCKYECPAGFCPKTMSKLHTLCEVVRAGGDLRLLGGPLSDSPMSIKFTCADGPVMFRLDGKKL